jgi:hypothetical protein
VFGDRFGRRPVTPTTKTSCVIRHLGGKTSVFSGRRCRFWRISGAWEHATSTETPCSDPLDRHAWLNRRSYKSFTEHHLFAETTLQRSGNENSTSTAVSASAPTAIHDILLAQPTATS